MTDIPVTRRKPGKANPSEIKGFQGRYKGVKVDGKVGDQTWGQVLLVEIECAQRQDTIDDLRAELAKLKANPPKCNLWKWIVASVAAFVTWLLGGFSELGAWITAALH